MTVQEVEAIRNRSKASEFGPWVTDFEEMAKKTVLRRLLKRLPLSSENYALAQAVEVDNKAALGEAEISADIIDIEGLEEAPQQKAALQTSPIAETTKGRRKSEPSEQPKADPLQSAIDALGLPVAVTAAEVREENSKLASPYDDTNLLANAAALANKIANRKA